VYSALPLYLTLQSSKTCYLWSLAFTSPENLSTSEAVVPGVVWKVTHESTLARTTFDRNIDTYFPELYMSQYLHDKHHINAPVYTAIRTGVRVLRPALQHVIDELSIDAVIMIDGGTDSLMKGDEIGLGTPHEDMLSIKSLYDCTVKKKLLVAIGFGIDNFHGVWHTHFLENTAELIRKGGFLGTFSLLREMTECQAFVELVQYAATCMEWSIVQSSVMNAALGHFGNYHSTQRTEGSDLFINPLMAIFWCYKLDPVAEQVMYLTKLGETSTFTEVDMVIKAFRKGYDGKIRQKSLIPH